MDGAEELLASLESEDDLGLVLRAHIHIESQLNRIFETYFFDAQYIEKIGLDYNQKVVLALACGLHPRFKKALNCIGQIRNRFAHTLDAKLGKGEADSLYKSFDGYEKQGMQKAYKATTSKFERPVPPSLSDASPRDRFKLIVISIHSILDIAVDDLLEISGNA